MTLADVRKNIDRVDKEIKQLFKERMVLADNVAQVKAETEDDIYKPDREEAIISNLTGDVDDNAYQENHGDKQKVPVWKDSGAQELPRCGV